MSAWPSLPVSTSGRTASLHPVWGSSTVDNYHRLELLLLLLRSEAERLTVWATPRDVLDADNRIHLSHTSDQDWQQYLLTAWSCDQRLALCLLERYPAITAVRRGLEALVMQHADDPALQQMPEAALLLATPAAVASNSPQLANLSVWAVCPLLRAMALMAGQAGAQPAVRSYCIRSLQATKPEEVTCPSLNAIRAPLAQIGPNMGLMPVCLCRLCMLLLHRVLYKIQSKPRLGLCECMEVQTQFWAKFLQGESSQYSNVHVLQVAFFLPQLVQLLRGDSNGMIQSFLFLAASRSNVFAYNLICILKVISLHTCLLCIHASLCAAAI